MKLAKKNSLGFRFDNSYLKLPSNLYTKIHPQRVSEPKGVIFNWELAIELNLNLADADHEFLAQIFSGNQLPDEANPIAQSYAGHQFGHFVILGDGRAHLIGEHLDEKGLRFDIQLKGSGRTPYSRNGDGRAALSPMLREYVMSEAMHALRIPTTRSLAVVLTGENVYRNQVESGAVLTRVAKSHIRVGTFQYVRILNDEALLKQFTDYVIQRHFQNISEHPNRYAELLKIVMQRQIQLVTEWLRVGFIHGVMNTDNMSICGETIDYGPCAFMDEYHPETVFSSIDRNGRYAFSNQPAIAKWNLTRFAESLLPLLAENTEKAVEVAKGILDGFDADFQASWLSMMEQKLGLAQRNSDMAEKSQSIIGELLLWMQEKQADYTNTFRDLTYGDLKAEIYQDSAFQVWHNKWQAALNDHGSSPDEIKKQMQPANPVLIPRNHQVEKALKSASENSDFSHLHQLLEALKKPYQPQGAYQSYQIPPSEKERVHQTFCGT